MTETTPHIALLCGMREPLGSSLVQALAAAGMTPVALAIAGRREARLEIPTLTIPLNDAAAIGRQLDTLERPPRALINYAALPLAMPSLSGRTLLPDLAYAPYDLYGSVIGHMRGGGNIVSLFGDMTATPDADALTLPSLKKLMRDLGATARAAGVRMNGVSVRHAPETGEASRTRILHERIATIVRLAQLDAATPDGEFFRGYHP